MSALAVGTNEQTEALLGTAQDTRKVEGTSRVIPVCRTLERIRDWLGEAGVSRIADVTGLDVLGIPVFNSIRPGAADGNLTVTSGKGADADSSRASAAMEAIERHYGEQHGRVGEQLTYGEASVTGHALHPSRLILNRDAEYREDQPIEWWPMRELRSGAEVLVPAQAVFVPYHGSTNLFGSSSNGLASGNSAPEALLHGMYEVIERDNVAFGETLLEGRQVALEGLPSGARRLVETMASNDIDVWIRYLPGPIDVPTFHVVIDDRSSNDPMLINGGFGTHLDPETALMRALCEAAQSRLSVISGAREDLEEHLGSRLSGYENVRARMTDWFTAWEPIRFDEIRSDDSDNVRQDVETVMSRLSASLLHRVFACELQPAEAPFSVVRVVVPGAEVAHVQRKRVGQRLRAARADHVR